jgi:sulfur carrier protein
LRLQGGALAFLPGIAARQWAHHTGGMNSSVTLTLNGEGRVFEGPSDGPLSVSALLAMLGLDTRKVAVERNEEIVPRSRYAETWLASGDSLEIVHFIGGG